MRLRPYSAFPAESRFATTFEPARCFVVRAKSFAAQTAGGQSAPGSSQGPTMRNAFAMDS